MTNYEKNDDKNRLYIKQILEQNFKELKINLSQDQYSAYDLSSNKGDLIELKERYIPSYSFNDNTCEYQKAEKIQKMIQEGKAKRAYIISTYSDGIIRISRLKDGQIIKRLCNQNTYYSNRSMIQKDLYVIKIYVDYKVENGKLIKINKGK